MFYKGREFDPLWPPLLALYAVGYWPFGKIKSGPRMLKGLKADFIAFRMDPQNSFKHGGLKRLDERDDRSGIRPDLLDTVERILTVLDSAETPQALDLPRYRLHLLKGDLKGLWSVTVRPNWGL